MTTALHTPDGRFVDLAGYPFAPNYVAVPDAGGGLPVHRSAAETGVAMQADATGMEFLHGVKFCAETPTLKAIEVVGFGSRGDLSDAEAQTYDAPFPDDRHRAGARVFPSLVPITPDNPAIAANRAAWQVLARWNKPFLTAFSDGDPVAAGRHERFQRTVPDARDVQPVASSGAGHFLQEEKPAEPAGAVLRFMADYPR